MKSEDATWRGVAVTIALVAATSFGCGGGGGGGGGGTATVSGNVSDVSTTERETAKQTWLARLGEELLGMARRAYAAADSSKGGIAVTVSRGGSAADDVTDDDGDFDVTGSPSGDVTVSFARGSCNATVSLPDVVDGSTLDLQNTTVDCDSASPGKVAETFQGVILNKPGSPNGNLKVCVFGGGGNHVRAVKTDEADFGGSTFADLEEGDLIEASGERAGNGGNSTLFATSVQRIGTSATGNCAGIPTPTPTLEPTVTGTETPTPDPTSTPTETPTP